MTTFLTEIGSPKGHLSQTTTERGGWPVGQVLAPVNQVIGPRSPFSIGFKNISGVRTSKTSGRRGRGLRKSRKTVTLGAFLKRCSKFKDRRLASSKHKKGRKVLFPVAKKGGRGREHRPER